MTDFASFAELRAACLDLPAGDDEAAAAVAQRDGVLTKPPGSLGRLEDIVSWLARWQGQAPPRLDRVDVIVFAGNHGVVAQGVSAFPADVTRQMVANFAAGGAAINQLAALAGATLSVSAFARRGHRGLHPGPGDGRDAIPRRGRRRLSRGERRQRPHLPWRDGDRQHDRRRGDRSRPVRRRWRALGGPRHRSR